MGRISLSSSSFSELALYIDLSMCLGVVAVTPAVDFKLATFGVDWKYPNLLHC